MHITVYAASSGQVPESYQQAAHQLGHCLAAHGHTLVNGAGRTGLMGATAGGENAVDGRAVGVIPQFMVEEHWEHTGMSELIVTPDMHSRKERMAQMADACIACPGGVGTLEEVVGVEHNNGTEKQAELFPSDHLEEFFGPLLAQLERCAEQQFMRRIHTDIWQVAATPEEAVRLCEETPLWDANVRRFAAL